MEKKIRRLLIIFFISMASFTVLSRAAASVMVAKVQVTAVKDGELSYEISGTGTIKENAQKYIDLYKELKIGKVYIKKGQQVEKGDLLFEYDMEQLNEKKSALDNELKKLQLQYEKTGLTSQSQSGPGEVKAAELAKKTAEEDLKAAKLALTDIKKSVRQKKEEDYKEAVSAWEDVKVSMEEALKSAERTVSDAESELTDLNKPQLSLNDKLEAYRKAVENKSEEGISEAYTEIFDSYYNGKYKEHQEEINDAEEKLRRAKEDLKDIKKKWDAAINSDDKYSDEEAVQKAYKEQLLSKKEEIKNADRAIEDAEDNLSKLWEKDDKLSSVLDNYREDIQKNNLNNVENTYAVLYQILYDNLEVDEKQIDTAATKLNRAKEDEEQISNLWSKKLNAASGKKEELKHSLMEIEEGTYNYEEDLKEGENIVLDKERALKNAELALAQAEENQSLAASNQQVQGESVNLDLSMISLDINEKQAEIEGLQTIISDKGKIYAAVAGTVVNTDLEQGITLTGQEKLIMATGGCELLITADKEDMEHFAVGDELEVVINTNNDKITTPIEHMELPDKEGKVNFTVLLPEGDYMVGGSLTYVMQKDSQTYPKCVPIQGLRKDSKGTYVLLVKAKDSVLGKEETAFRLNVTVVTQDDKSAAIEASLSEEDQIIISSNKNISEGDRVRIYEAE